MPRIFVPVLFFFLASCDLFFPPSDFKGPFAAPTPESTPGPVPTPLPSITPQPDGNLIYNGDFSQGTTYWASWINTGDGASGTIGAPSGILEAIITNGSTERWHIQLMYNNLTFTLNRKYTLTFDAWAEAGRDVYIEIQENNFDNNGDGNYYTSYDSHLPWLDTSPESYSLDFVMTHPTDVRARLVFNLGNFELDAKDVFIDNVKLIESDVTIPPHGSNNIYNGDFSAGTSGWWMYAYDAGGASGSISVLSGELRVTVDAISASQLDLQAIQGYPGQPLLAGGNYRLTFDSRAESARDISVILYENGHDLDHDSNSWEAYCYGDFGLTTANARYTFYFNQPSSNYDSGFVIFCGHSLADVFLDNIFLTSIGGPVPLSGGSGSASAASVPNPDTWYTGSLSGSAVWYSASVTAGLQYNVYLDDGSQGSGAYTADAGISVYRTNGTTLYSSSGSAYTNPITLIPAESSILIMIAPLADGTYAFDAGLRN